MHYLEKILNRIHDFLAANDFPSLLEAIRKLEWSHVIGSPYTWLIVLPILIYLFWTRKFKTITAVVSFFLFLLLVQKTLSPPGETLSLHDLLIFLSGTVALVGINLYLIFVRQ
ncbi:MAG TPA: hypothetical protein VEF34_06040 [Syntrophobacteraceae bacterium]|nr:hypothetical protein [Syntrophobacteraceae bacterium]